MRTLRVTRISECSLMTLSILRLWAKNIAAIAATCKYVRNVAGTRFSDKRS